ncbi:ATP-binding protein [Mucilaginibacter sp.]|uniref:sensor histidine kinase n=1 Tax=Mucilaginibacter sp. TaxID=1882438 RepID=UPI00261B05D6|nr:ATP-binding protein [Mucilaginibacter sp.]MDB5030998.1 sensor histidine kinase [Mucilaginibacter sp.]
MHKSFLFKINLTVFLFFVCSGLKAQDNPIKQAFEFPTKEIYDLHVDKHGFLWIASDFGVARYDGINCVHFSSPRQISLGCTNLLEDNYGRIWFNNFNGQIFYIDHETVTLAESYDYKNEHNYPRMILFHDQLLATSDKGLFVLNTRNLTGKYISTNTYTSSLAVLKDQVLVHGDQTWYSYKTATGLKKITYTGDDQILGNIYTLANNTYKDTVYLMANPSGIIKKLLVQNDTVKQYRQFKFNSFINTLSITADNQWINTTDCSYSLKNGEKIKGYNLSAIVTDLEGNKWFSSLYYGLLLQHKKDIANKTIVPALDHDDLVVSIKSYKGKLLLGTQKGFLILYDPASKNTGFKIKVSPATGSINHITAINQDDYIVASSLSTYKVNIPTKKVIELVNIKTVKQLCYDNKAIYIASTSGLFVLPHEKSDRLNQQIMRAFGHVFKYSAADNDFYLRIRSRAISYFPDQASLFVAFKNGLFKIDKNGMKPFLFNNEQVYAASLAYTDHRLYIGTISNGMLVVEKNGANHISVQNGLFSKSIFNIKPINKNLWIVGSGPLQLFNTQKMALVDNYEFPDRSASEVFDLDGVGQMIYLATSSGLDNFPLVKNSVDKKLKNYLLYVKVNNKIATGNSSHKLAYSENNVLFNIGIPAYLKAKDIYIKYCLATKTDSTWLTTEPGERTIRFSSLMPGTYTLKAIAVDPRLGMADTMLNYDFTIAQPWWGGIGFKIILGLVLLLLILYGYLTMLLKRLALKKTFDIQQQLILAERQRISAEMHDDIGSGVFAIQSLADTASKNENAGPEIGQIKNMVNDLSVKIREVIWSTNVGNDNLENLLYYTYFQINKLFEHSEIDLVSELPDDIIDLKITGQSRRNIYLLVKELVHNAIKHSKATTIELKMFTDEQMLYISIADNGVGINPTHARPGGMGLGNIKSRVEKLNGQLSIANNEGAHISIKLPLSALKVIEFDKKLNKWQLFMTSLLKTPSDPPQDK